MFSKVLIANRGEIACRVIGTAQRLGIATVAVYSDADRDALHVELADEAVAIGPPPAAESYLDGEKLIAACRATGAEAVHPGYGFLSENAGFAAACAEAGIVFVGPPAAAIDAMGDKIRSKRIAREAGVAVVRGEEATATAEEAARLAERIGYPVMIKASAGGGGKGMRIAHNDGELREGFDRARSEAAASFGDDRLFVERFISDPRHIEIQVLADRHGNCIHLGERECSIQRRHQKVIEEAPSPFLDAATRAAMAAEAVALARAIGYQGAGTVEFIVDAEKTFYFLEMNTRLQVEHPVTELVTGLDVVEQQFRIAAGEALRITQDDVELTGWAIEARVYAEDPYRGFLPSPGRLARYRPPQEKATAAVVVRNDSGVVEGGEVSPHYDPMISKLSTWAPDRTAAIEAMAEALDRFELDGIGHNIPLLQAVMDQPRFRDGRLSTAYLAEEFGDGFSGAEIAPSRRSLFVAIAVILAEIRANRVETPAPRGSARAVFVDGARIDVTVEADGTDRWLVAVPDHDPQSFAIAWSPGDTLAIVNGQDDAQRVVKVAPTITGFRLRHRGADLEVKVMSPQVADLMMHMSVRKPPDRSNHLLSPMPGQIVRLEVVRGDRVEPGQPLVIVEAMKMENILRAERRALVARINCEVGTVVAVDDVILEFGEV